jgi:hypothetical protein
VVACDRVGCVAEADALDVAGVVDGVAMGSHCHLSAAKNLHRSKLDPSVARAPSG